MFETRVLYQLTASPIAPCLLLSCWLRRALRRQTMHPTEEQRRGHSGVLYRLLSLCQTSDARRNPPCPALHGPFQSHRPRDRDTFPRSLRWNRVQRSNNCTDDPYTI